MQTSCSSWSYHRTIKAGAMDQLAWIKECAALELDGVELLGDHFPKTDRGYLIELKKLCADNYLIIAIITTKRKNEQT